MCMYQDAKQQKWKMSGHLLLFFSQILEHLIFSNLGAFTLSHGFAPWYVYVCMHVCIYLYKNLSTQKFSFEGIFF